MQKPLSINLTAGIMAVFIVLGLMAAFMKAPLMPSNMASNPMITPGLIASIAHGVEIFGAIIAAVCVLFYWKGHEWARWLVMIDSVWILIMLFSIMKTWHFSHFNGVLVLARAVLAIYLLWNLNTAPIRAWFKAPKTGEAAA